MRNVNLLLVACLLLVFSCQKKEAKLAENNPELEAADAPAQRCASQEVLEEKLAADPSLRQRMQQIEDFTQKVIKNKSQYRLLQDGTIEIPVYFHVLYRTADENITNEQLQSQIDVLNEDFNEANPDVKKVPAHFAGVVTNVKIKFTWTAGPTFTNRKYASKRQWSTNDDMKFDAKGGSNVYQPQNYLKHLGGEQDGFLWINNFRLCTIPRRPCGNRWHRVGTQLHRKNR
jgi:hypothetical protein